MLVIWIVVIVLLILIAGDAGLLCIAGGGTVFGYKSADSPGPGDVKCACHHAQERLHPSLATRHVRGSKVRSKRKMAEQCSYQSPFQLCCSQRFRKRTWSFGGEVSWWFGWIRKAYATFLCPIHRWACEGDNGSCYFRIAGSLGFLSNNIPCNMQTKQIHTTHTHNTIETNHHTEMILINQTNERTKTLWQANQQTNNRRIHRDKACKQTKHKAKQTSTPKQNKSMTETNPS